MTQDDENEKALVAVSEFWGRSAARLVKKNKALEDEIERLNGTLNTVVFSLGGIVEGLPTGRHNFLQRIRELVKLESKKKSDKYTGKWAQGCLDVTKLLVEHPEEWDGPCACQLCQSYEG